MVLGRGKFNGSLVGNGGNPPFFEHSPGKPGLNDSIAYGTGGKPILADLARVKAVFQLRAISAVMGLPHPPDRCAEGSLAGSEECDWECPRS